MSLRIAAMTVWRVLNQLRRDRRTVALLLIMPSVLMTLLRYVFDGSPMVFDRIGVTLLGIFPFIVMFLVTSVAMLRERTSGTLERLLTTPISKLDLLAGYGTAFALVAAVQTLLTCATTLWLLDLHVCGNLSFVIGISVADAVLGAALGLLVSAFAATEFQAVQFMPAIVMPQLLLCGLFAPRDSMASWLDAASSLMPLSYVVEALSEVARHTEATAILWRDLGIVVGLIGVCLVLAAVTLRRKTP